MNWFPPGDPNYIVAEEVLYLVMFKNGFYDVMSAYRADGRLYWRYNRCGVDEVIAGDGIALVAMIQDELNNPVPADRLLR